MTDHRGSGGQGVEGSRGRWVKVEESVTSGPTSSLPRVLCNVDQSAGRKEFSRRSSPNNGGFKKTPAAND